ncbi:hypothetical protein A5881_003618 [Enterococcus termitis]
MILNDLLDSSFTAYKERVAVSQGERKITYDTLDKISNEYAKYLNRTCKNTFVGVYMNSSIEAMISIISILKSGRAYVPIDPSLPKDRTQYIFKDSDISFVFTTPETSNLLKEIQSPEMNLSKIEINIPTTPKNFISFDPSQFSQGNILENIIKSDSPAYMIYTSGSTGNPKGVIISNSNICDFLIWNQKKMNYSIGDKIGQNHSLSFDNSVWEIFSAFLSGAELVIVEDNKNILTLIEVIHSKKITSLSITPSQLTVLLEYCDVVDVNSLKSLNYLFIGSETVPVEIVEKAFKYLNSKCRVFNEYGPTEVTITSAMLEVTIDNLNNFKAFPSLPIGNPTASNIFEIAEGGTEGELLIGGGCVAIGYHNNEDKNLVSFIDVKDVEFPGRYYKTGDLVKKIDDNNFMFLGRIDDQVKIRGFRVEIGEVEKAIRGLQIVSNLVVVAVEDKEISTRKLVCYYIGKEQTNQKTIPTIIRKKLKEILPDYMIPTSFIQIDEIPLNHNKKIDRKKMTSVSFYNHTKENRLKKSDEMENNVEKKL